MNIVELSSNNMVKDFRYTLAVPFSRCWAVDKWFSMFSTQKWPFSMDELSVLIFCDNNNVISTVTDYIKSYENISYKIFGDRSRSKLPEMGKVEQRRKRIAEIWEFLWRSSPGEIILGSEDDSIPEEDSYSRLLRVLEHDDSIGFVQGTIIGRWRCPCVPHWKNSGNKWETQAPDGNELMDIDGGGWYCFAARKDAGLLANWKYSDLLPVGPDVTMVNSIRNNGYKVIGHWGVWVDHITEGNTLSVENSIYNEKLTFYKNDHDKYWSSIIEVVPKPVKPEGVVKDMGPLELVKVVARRSFYSNEVGNKVRNQYFSTTYAMAKQLYQKKLVDYIPEPVKIEEGTYHGKSFFEEILPEVDDLLLEDDQDMGKPPKGKKVPNNKPKGPKTTPKKPKK